MTVLSNSHRIINTNQGPVWIIVAFTITLIISVVIALLVFSHASLRIGHLFRGTGRPMNLNLLWHLVFCFSFPLEKQYKNELGKGYRTKYMCKRNENELNNRANGWRNMHAILIHWCLERSCLSFVSYIWNLKHERYCKYKLIILNI
jgi:hypothetical protein